jgi:hypothetical protein
MRQVRVTAYKDKTEVKFLGVFHDFAMNSFVETKFVDIYPVAIVEDASGNIHLIETDRIQFVNALDYKTCEDSPHGK